MIVLSLILNTLKMISLILWLSIFLNIVLCKEMYSTENNIEEKDVQNDCITRSKRTIPVNSRRLFAELEQISNKVDDIRNQGAAKRQDYSSKIDNMASKMQQLQKAILSITNLVTEQNSYHQEYLRRLQNVDNRVQEIEKVMSTNFNLVVDRTKNEINKLGKEVNILKKGQETILGLTNITNGQIERQMKHQHLYHNFGNDCGDSLVAENGTLKFGFVRGNYGARKCIWTIRANKRSKVVFSMKGNSEGNISSFLTLTPYKIHTQLTNTTLFKRNTTKLLFNEEVEHEVEGPLVFVTLYYKPEDWDVDFSNFTLHFTGGSEDENSPWKYSHYHFTEYSKRVKYPLSGNKYKPNELVTFVVNPMISSDFELTLSYLNIENETLCRHDSVTILYEQKDYIVPYYSRFGFLSSDYRFCGLDGDMKETTGRWSSFAYIVIFKSNANAEYNGFKFSWDV